MTTRHLRADHASRLVNPPAAPSSLAFIHGTARPTGVTLNLMSRAVGVPDVRVELTANDAERLHFLLGQLLAEGATTNSGAGAGEP